ncbi:MAG: FKBP-type peptidyl-prolyl cis-trans isomerase [Bacteroidales bacterium]|nr:FKBP-type peptidyl-prolyl cis-trans isomerase [Bacteroidales bacterium]
MKKTILSMAALAMLMLGTMSACTEQSPYPGYKKSDTGLYYQFFTQNKEAEQPKVGDLVDLRIFAAVNDTSIIVANTENTLQIEEPKFAGDFYEALTMMHKGDSASFIVNIDSTFIKWFHQPSLPAEFQSTDVMRFEVRLDDFYPESEYATRLSAKIKKESDARIEKMKADHPEETATAAQQLTEYLAKNKIEVEPTASGLYYVMTQEGNGEKPEPGQMVQVHYTGKLLDGTLFDSSVERGQPISIPIGVGQVIPGWDEGIMMMSKGEKGVLYIPYYLAYGDRQAGDKITPFSNLMFEVELVDIQ